MVFAVDTCDTLSERWSTLDNNITKTLFAAWNPYLLGTCDMINPAQYVCKPAAPGGIYNLPAPVYAPSASSEDYVTATPPVPTATGTIKGCGKYYAVAAGDKFQNMCAQWQRICTMPTVQHPD